MGKTSVINQVMTIVEAAERYGVNADTLKNNFKRSLNKEKIDTWVAHGLIRQSGKTWLITDTFMEMYYKNYRPFGKF